MNSSIFGARFAFAGAVLLGVSAAQAGATDTSRNQPAEIRLAQQHEQPSRPGQGAQPGQGQQQGQQGQQGQQPGQQPGQAQQQGEQGKVNERELCTRLTREANIKVEDDENGVSLVLTTKEGASLSTLAQTAQQLERAMTTTGQQQQQPPAQGERCALFDLRRMGAQPTVTQEKNSIRLRFTAAKEGDVKELRRQAHEFARQPAPGGGQQQK